MDKVIFLKNGEADPYKDLPSFGYPEEAVFNGNRYSVTRKIRESSLIKKILSLMAVVFTLGGALKSKTIRGAFKGRKVYELRRLLEGSLNMTEVILKSGNFTQSFPGSMRNGFKVGEAQGSKNLRKNARLLTLDHPDALNPENLKEAKDSHPSNYRFLKLKRLGHAFSMEKNVGEFGFEGFSEDFTLPMLSSSLFRAEAEIGGDGKFRFAGEALNRSFSNEWAPKEKLEEALKTIHNPSSNEVVSIASGYDWHQTHVLFFKGHLIYVNKGNFGKGGIMIYQIPNPKKVTLDMLQRLAKRQDYTSETFLSEDKLISTLLLKRVTSVPLKRQIVGNCTYVNTRSAARVLMAIYSQLKSPDLSINGWVNSFQKIRYDYKRFFYFDRGLVLEDLKDDKDDYEFFSRKDLFRDLRLRIRHPERYNQNHMMILRD